MKRGMDGKVCCPGYGRLAAGHVDYFYEGLLKTY